MYNKYFVDYEYRRMMVIDALITILFAPIQFIFVLRLNLQWGIPDGFFVVFLDIIDEIVSQCFIYMPMCVIYAKITPQNIEATSFALLAGVSNFKISFRSWMGSWLNDAFVGVTKDDLSNYWQLILMNFVGSFLPLFFLWLIPTKEEINRL